MRMGACEFSTIAAPHLTLYLCGDLGICRVSLTHQVLNQRMVSLAKRKFSTFLGLDANNDWKLFKYNYQLNFYFSLQEHHVLSREVLVYFIYTSLQSLRFSYQSFKHHKKQKLVIVVCDIVSMILVGCLKFEFLCRLTVMSNVDKHKGHLGGL